MKTISMILGLVLISSFVMAEDRPVPPKPDNSKKDRYEWRRAYEKCLQKPTKFMQEKCLRDLYK